MRYLTAESVTMGHPDKIADLISDSILTRCLEQDKDSHVACEVLLTAGTCVIAGEITTRAKVNYAGVAKEAIESVGYSTKGIEFIVRVHEQSPDIAAAVANAEDESQDDSQQGAGDQGIVYGYATDETEELLPLPFVIARAITYLLTVEKMHNPVIQPDGKSQVTVGYNDFGEAEIKSVVCSAQHIEPTLGLDMAAINESILKIAKRVVSDQAKKYGAKCSETKYFINPSGKFVIGGFEADTGLTGRKLMVDTYGGLAHHGGGAFSGKDPSKLDRSGAYMARYIAKNIVAAGIAKECEVSLAYAIGHPTPLAVDVTTFGTAIIPDEALRDIVEEVFPLTPSGIIKDLHLKDVQYDNTVIYGHFGNQFAIDKFPWEKTDRAVDIAELAKSMRETYFEDEEEE